MKILLENLGCKPVYEVYKTKNYSIFKESFDNRIDFKNEPDTTKYKRLKESIRKCGKNLEPITVREIENGTKFEVIKGHHRYWATRMTDSELYFRIDNCATLDESIEETKGTTNWTETDLLERGIRHNIKICTIVKDIEDRFPKLKDSKTLTARLVWGYLKLKDYPGRNKILKSLEDINEIQELKNIDIPDTDITKLREFVYRFIETISVCDETYLEERDIENNYNRLNIVTMYVEMFTKYYKFIARNYDDYIKEWKRICTVKSNKTSLQRDKETYKKMTSRDRKFIEQAIMEICTKIEKFDF